MHRTARAALTVFAVATVMAPLGAPLAAAAASDADVRLGCGATRGRAESRVAEQGG